jgi:hypothetical protein
MDIEVLKNVMQDLMTKVLRTSNRMTCGELILNIDEYQALETL